MMKAPSWPLLIFLALLLISGTVGSIAWKLGAFKDVGIVTQSDGPFLILSKQHLGPYHKIAEVILEVEAWARSQGEPCTLSFGEFFDDPERTDEDRLRSRAGCILSKTSKTEIQSLTSKLADGYSIQTIEKRLYSIATFHGAPSLGPVKVYPKIREYLDLNRLKLDGSVIEIYEVHSASSGSTRYLFPVEPISVR
jgi:AraC family transcriptional regulator